MVPDGSNNDYHFPFGFFHDMQEEGNTFLINISLFFAFTPFLIRFLTVFPKKITKMIS